jgi:hypothetical protein
VLSLSKAIILDHTLWSNPLLPLERIAHDWLPSKGCVRSVPKENNFTCRTHYVKLLLKVANGILHDVLVVGYYITDHNRLFRSWVLELHRVLRKRWTQQSWVSKLWIVNWRMGAIYTWKKLWHFCLWQIANSFNSRSNLLKENDFWCKEWAHAEQKRQGSQRKSDHKDLDQYACSLGD